MKHGKNKLKSSIDNTTKIYPNIKLTCCGQNIQYDS